MYGKGGNQRGFLKGTRGIFFCRGYQLSFLVGSKVLYQGMKGV